MARCLWCRQVIRPYLSFSFICMLKSYHMPKLCSTCQALCQAVDPDQSCPQCCRQQDHSHLCQDCQRWQDMRPLHPHQSLFYYQGLVKDWLRHYKYRGDYRLREIFTDPLVEVLTPKLSDYTLVPIPISKASQAQRGFNQVSALLEAAQLPYQELLMNQSTGKKQADKNRKERMQSPQVFQLDVEKYKAVKNKNFIIIDDVYTTGRTIFHAYDALQQTGQEKIESLTIAR